MLLRVQMWHSWHFWLHIDILKTLAVIIAFTDEPDNTDELARCSPAMARQALMDAEPWVREALCLAVFKNDCRLCNHGCACSLWSQLLNTGAACMWERVPSPDLWYVLSGTFSEHFWVYAFAESCGWDVWVGADFVALAKELVMLNNCSMQNLVVHTKMHSPLSNELQQLAKERPIKFKIVVEEHGGACSACHAAGKAQCPSW